MNETNPLQGKHPDTGKRCVYWTDPSLARITRLRFLSDPGHPFWDLSYCYGQLKDGRYTRVSLPFDRLLKNAPISKQIVKYAKQDGVYAAGLGIFSVISTLN